MADTIVVAPIDMIIFCPRCGRQHVDEATSTWANPPHRSHLCLECSWVFRVADVPTNGVRELLTHGAGDNLPIRGVQSVERMTCLRHYGIDPGSK
jgi:hypothetical protein